MSNSLFGKAIGQSLDWWCGQVFCSPRSAARDFTAQRLEVFGVLLGSGSIALDNTAQLLRFPPCLNKLGVEESQILPMLCRESNQILPQNRGILSDDPDLGLNGLDSAAIFGPFSDVPDLRLHYIKTIMAACEVYPEISMATLAFSTCLNGGLLRVL